MSPAHGREVATLTGSPLNRRFGIPLHVAHYTGGSFRTHYHSFLELVIVNADSGHNVIDGRRTGFRRRQVYQLGMFHPHRIEAPDGGHCDYYNITFQPEVVSSGSPRPSPGDPLLAPFYSTVPAQPFLLPEDEYAGAVTLCETIRREEARSDRHTAAIALGLFQALTGLVGRHSPGAGLATDDRVQAVLRAISERFHEQLETRELADLVGVSPSRLAQLFRRYTGSTVRHALLRRRLTEAKRLLATTEIPITELLLASGFNDVSYFNRSFRADTGLTPREYRKQALGERTDAV
jgi:AraC-like DNA-binding protein